MPRYASAGYSGVPTPWRYAEGHTDCAASARRSGTPRGQRPHARTETPRTGTPRSRVPLPPREPQTASGRGIGPVRRDGRRCQPAGPPGVPADVPRPRDGHLQERRVTARPDPVPRPATGNAGVERCRGHCRCANATWGGIGPGVEIIFLPLEWRNQALEPPQIHACTLAAAVVASRSRGARFSLQRGTCRRAADRLQAPE